MASSSSSSASKAYNYDVFLSFRGKDTRHSFTDHLYERLIQAGLYTFRDDEEIKRGEELKPEIEKAIKESRASIVVLSKNYATSTWCLDELNLILEQRRHCNHFVLPVFYDVDPSDVRKQKGSFEIQVKSSSKWTCDNVNMWKAALMEIADLAGEVVTGRPETSILKKIVNTTYNKLRHQQLDLPSNVTGMVTRYEDISSWLDQSNLEFLAIYGMGGSGKTTLAKYIYNSNWQRFEHVSFVEHINSRCETPKGLLEVQEQLLKDISGGKKRKIPGVFRGVPIIGEALQTKKTLIVLDDIVGHRQLVDLLGNSEINTQSKIIITTRENTDNWLDFSNRRCQAYKMRLLNDDESSKLLCRHAFRSVIPKEGFHKVVSRLVQYCEGNPLALEVLGSLMYTNDLIMWESQLRLLENDIDNGVQGVLMRSYTSLPSDSVKKLFLHIACFFNGKDMDYVAKILEPNYSAIHGIKVLTDRCLLSISPNKKIIMHRLVQEMGKHIVRQESKFPAKRTRVWLSNDSYKILKKGIGSETIEGLALDMKMLQEESSTSRSSELKTNALQNMDSLKLLQLNFVELDGPYDSFSEDLRWLCWFGFPLETIPPELYMGHLVAIDMSYSKLITFEPPAVLESLKVLNLKDSHSLVEIGNIFMIPCLETLVLWNCYNLTKVCDTIEDLKRLALLNMTGCNQPFIFRFPSSLRQLFLKDCNLEEDFRKTRIRFLNLEYLQYLSLVNNPLISYDVFIRFMMNLRVLDMSFCSRVKYLYMLPSTLKELYIYYCESLEIVSFSSQRFTLQEIGYEGCISLREIEGFIKLVPIAQLFYKIGSTHFAWIYKYRKHKVCLVGDDELTVGRSWQLQMLYEFDIMSTSLPDIKDPNMTPKYISKSSSLSFEVPLCPENKRLEGINVSFKYALSGDVWVWFCKISTKNGLDLMYNPKVFGKPEVGEVCIWLSYWPIGNKLSTGDTVHVSIVEISGLKVHECGVSLVYSDKKSFRYIRDCKSLLERESSNFQLSTGAYYFCRRDFFELTEVGRLTLDWFRILVGDTIDDTEVRGWRKTGRPQHMNPPSIELKMVKCILDGPQLEDIYNTAEMSKSSSSGYKPLAEMISGTKSDPYSNIVSEALAKPLEADLKLSIKSGKEDELEYEYGKEDEPPYESGDEDDDDDAY